MSRYVHETVSRKLRMAQDLVTPELKTFAKLSNALNNSISYLSNFNQLPENTLAEKIRKYRYLKGWSHRTLAKKANVDPSTIMKIETGKTKNPTNKIIKKIEKALGCYDFMSQ